MTSRKTDWACGALAMLIMAIILIGTVINRLEPPEQVFGRQAK